MITLTTWSDEAERALAAACYGNAIEVLRHQVQSGVAQLWFCDGDGSRFYAVTRVEMPAQEWVCLAVAGHGVARFARAFVAIAKGHKLMPRIHVVAESKARLRLWARFGFKIDEFVLRAA